MISLNYNGIEWDASAMTKFHDSGVRDGFKAGLTSGILDGGLIGILATSVGAFVTVIALKKKTKRRKRYS